VSQAKLDAFHDQAKARLEPFGCTIVRKFSVEAAKDFADGSLDFVYIDGNHEFSHVAADLAAWIPKIRKAGIVSGHDWCQRTDVHGTNPYSVHVVECVTGWVTAYHVYPYFILGRKACLDGETRDRPRSFFWVKR